MLRRAATAVLEHHGGRWNSLCAVSEQSYVLLSIIAVWLYLLTLDTLFLIDRSAIDVCFSLELPCSL